VHGLAVLHAISDALASVDNYRTYPGLNAPATPEQILRVAERLRQHGGVGHAQGHT
jgi:xanthine dehydrogenase large subunit